MHSAMTVTLRIAPSCTLATGRSRAAGVASATAEGPKVKSAPLSRRVVGLTGILSGASVLSSGFRDAKAEEDTLGETIEKLEEIEPLVAEELKAIEASGGAGEVKEVVADILNEDSKNICSFAFHNTIEQEVETKLKALEKKEVEAKLEALEKEVDTLGGEADPLGLTAAAAPLKQRLKELGDLIALFAPK